MAMDARNLRSDSALNATISDGKNNYEQTSVSLQCETNKSYQDIGSNSLGKVEAQGGRPCAIIGPDRVVPPPPASDAYLKKAAVEPWPCTNPMYQPQADFPQKLPEYQSVRNISPRQTFQENMQRIMMPPSYSSKHLDDNLKNSKVDMPLDVKYCDVPYAVNPAANNQKSIRNQDVAIPGSNPPFARSVQPFGWTHCTPRPHRPCAPEFYQYSELPNYAVPRPIQRLQRPSHEDPGLQFPSDRLYQDSSIRYKPYPNPKERYNPHRYDYIANYPNTFHPHPTFPSQKFDGTKTMPSHPYPVYPHVSIRRIPEPILDPYQRSTQPNFNPYQNQYIPPYGPVPGNCIPSKLYPYPDIPPKSMCATKLPYDINNKVYVDYENVRSKMYPSVDSMPYYTDISRQNSIKGDISQPMHTGIAMQHVHNGHMFRKDLPLRPYENLQYRGVDPALYVNNSVPRYSMQFSPSTMAKSPIESSIVSENILNLQEDCGYVNQSSSVRSDRLQSEMFRKKDNMYISNSTNYATSINNNIPENKKGLNVRQFLQMWNEGEDDVSENNTNSTSAETFPNVTPSETVTNPEQLVVLGLVNIPNEELSKYEHIQKISKLPENIKGYNSIELLDQYEQFIEKPAVKHNRMIDQYHSSPKANPNKTNQTSLLQRPISPLDVEAKISQSVIHKEVGCNFEIKPCSPKMLNVEAATPIQNIIEEREIEKVINNSLTNPTLLPTRHETLSVISPSSSCKMSSPYITNNDLIKNNNSYSFQDLESNSGVCLASLPRLDSDLELNFPEINQQFIDANKSKSKECNDDVDTNLKCSLKEDEYNTKVDSTKETSEINPFIETSKLSKYRKNKADTLPECNPTNPSNKRTDSVIIKNPDNIKRIDEVHSPDYIHKESEKNTTSKASEFDNENLNCSALDFSLNNKESQKYEVFDKTKNSPLNFEDNFDNTHTDKDNFSENMQSNALSLVTRKVEMQLRELESNDGDAVDINIHENNECTLKSKTEETKLPSLKTSENQEDVKNSFECIRGGENDIYRNNDNTFPENNERKLEKSDFIECGKEVNNGELSEVIPQEYSKARDKECSSDLNNEYYNETLKKTLVEAEFIGEAIFCNSSKNEETTESYPSIEDVSIKTHIESENVNEDSKDSKSNSKEIGTPNLNQNLKSCKSSNFDFICDNVKPENVKISGITSCLANNIIERDTSQKIIPDEDIVNSKSEVCENNLESTDNYAGDFKNIINDKNFVKINESEHTDSEKLIIPDNSKDELENPAQVIRQNTLIERISDTPQVQDNIDNLKELKRVTKNCDDNCTDFTVDVSISSKKDIMVHNTQETLLTKLENNVSSDGDVELNTILEDTTKNDDLQIVHEPINEANLCSVEDFKGISFHEHRTESGEIFSEETDSINYTLKPNDLASISYNEIECSKDNNRFSFTYKRRHVKTHFKEHYSPTMQNLIFFSEGICNNSGSLLRTRENELPFVRERSPIKDNTYEIIDCSYPINDSSNICLKPITFSERCEIPYKFVHSNKLNLFDQEEISQTENKKNYIENNDYVTLLNDSVSCRKNMLHDSFVDVLKPKEARNLKRSLSDSALDLSCENEIFSRYTSYKKMKITSDEVAESHINDNVICNSIQNSRRNSISTVYNNENVFILLEDNEFIIAHDDHDSDSICFNADTQNNFSLPEGNVNNVTDTEYDRSEIVIEAESNVISLQSGHAVAIQESWIDESTVNIFNDDVAADITISAPLSPVGSDTSNDDTYDSNKHSDNESEHIVRMKEIYGDSMCVNDVQIVETLYNMPQMDVNKTLGDIESNDPHINLNEDVILSPNKIQNEISISHCQQEHCNADFGELNSQDSSEYICTRRNYSDGDRINTKHSTFVQDSEVNDSVDSYDEINSPTQMLRICKSVSSSPEVSSTTSEEKSSATFLKLHGYNDSSETEINDISENIVRECYNMRDNNYYTTNFRPLITKAAQKYIPPLIESKDLKVKLPLPQKSLNKLKMLKLARQEVKIEKINVNKSVVETNLPRQMQAKKVKPKFEDVLKSIDEIQFKMHKEKSRKVRHSIPKVIIKKNESGSHYASTPKKDSSSSYNPDLTGRKWQPWVFLERNNFVDKMALRNKRRAIYCHRKKTFVLEEKFRKYKSICTAKFVITQPTNDKSLSGNLKYTIRLKHNY